MRNKASDLSLHRLSHGKKEQDGRTEDSTLVHKALVQFYQDRNQQIPSWLLPQSKQTYHQHTHSSSSSNTRASASPVAQPQQSHVAGPPSVVQPRTYTPAGGQGRTFTPAQQHQPTTTSGERHTSVQSMGEMRRYASYNSGPSSNSNSDSSPNPAFPPKPVARSNTTNSVGKSRRRFG